MILRVHLILMFIIVKYPLLSILLNYSILVQPREWWFISDKKMLQPETTSGTPKTVLISYEVLTIKSTITYQFPTYYQDFAGLISDCSLLTLSQGSGTFFRLLWSVLTDPS